ncbi:larval cuticle protein LCP-22-like [Colias croceus]|uniref:larval cuticle protein LCP-22-like n=1 Tax=Colias crocea TaxID=72248 RepID=UPI001E27A99C|nr:larval cuticle protein LCP-22-like [Colias croceus]
MRFAVVVLACVLAVANAQFNQGQYFGQQDQSGQYKKYNGQYNAYNPYNQYNNRYNNQYNRYNNQYQQNYTPFKQFASTTPFPVRAVTVTEAPAAIAAVKVSSAPATSPVVVPAPVPVVPVARVVADARSAETLRYGNEINEDGAYNYFFETNNGIAAQAQGTPRNFGGNPPVVPDVAQGSFSWTSPEGEVISITYVADENGYQPSGNAIPQPPPVPAQIARALEYIAKYAPPTPVASASAVARN